MNRRKKTEPYFKPSVRKAKAVKSYPKSQKKYHQILSSGYKSTLGNTPGYSYKPKTIIGSSSKKTFLKTAKTFSHHKKESSIFTPIDPEIIRFRAELAALNSPQAKKITIEKFNSKNPGKKFYKIFLTKKGLETDLRIINMAILGIKKHLLCKDIKNDNGNSYIVGGLAYLPDRKMDQIDTGLFSVVEMDLMNGDTQREFLEVMERAMGFKA